MSPGLKQTLKDFFFLSEKREHSETGWTKCFHDLIYGPVRVWALSEMLIKT